MVYRVFMKNLKIALIVLCLISNTTFATTLSDALVQAYQNNPELIAAREKLKATDEQMYRAISGFLPTIQYAARKTYQKNDTDLTASTTNIGQTQAVKTSPWNHNKRRTTDVNIQQNLFNGGQDVMAVRIAKYTIEAAREELLATEQKVLSDAINAFLGVIYAKQVLEINKENVLAYEKRYEAIKERVLAGVDKQTDLAKTAAGKADAYTNLTVASGNYESSLAEYIRVVGEESSDLVIGENLGQIPANQMELLSKSLLTNPSLMSVMLQQKAADIGVYSNAARLLPTVDIGGNIGKSWQKDSAAATQPYTNSKTAYIQVSVPIFNKGLEFSYTREASAKAANLKYIVRNTKSAVTQESSRMWNSYVGTLESSKSAAEAVKASSIALDAIQQSYDEGVDRLTDLLDAQQDLYFYKTKLAKVIYDLGVSRYNLLTLIGTLNAKDLALPTKIYNPATNYDKVKFELIGF